MEPTVSKTCVTREKLFIISLVLVIILAAILPGPLPAQAIRIGSLGLSGPLLPLWIAQDKGLFAKQGLTSEAHYLPRRHTDDPSAFIRGDRIRGDQHRHGCERQTKRRRYCWRSGMGQ